MRPEDDKNGELKSLLREAHRSLPPRTDFQTLWRAAARGDGPRPRWVLAAMALGLALVFFWIPPLSHRGPEMKMPDDLSMATDFLLEERSASLELRALPLLDDETDDTLTKGEL